MGDNRRSAIEPGPLYCLANECCGNRTTKHAQVVYYRRTTPSQSRFVGGAESRAFSEGEGTLATYGADEGTYHLRVTVNPSAGLAFVLDEDEPQRPPVGSLPVVEVPGGLTTYQVYLPLVLRTW